MTIEFTPSERNTALNLLYERLAKLQADYESADRRGKQVIRAERKRIGTMIGKLERRQ